MKFFDLKEVKTDQFFRKMICVPDSSIYYIEEDAIVLTDKTRIPILPKERSALIWYLDQPIAINNHVIKGYYD